MIKSNHVTEQELIALLDDDRESEDAQRIGEHVHECEKCRKELDALAANPCFWEKTPDHLKGQSIAQPETNSTELPSPKRPFHELGVQLPIPPILDPPQHPEMIGRIGKYDVEREIGRGGMGMVFKAHDSELNRPLAIKILSPQFANHATARKRFAQEAIAAAGVIHPNVIAVHGVSNEGRTPFIVMPYVSGPSLQSLIEEQGPLSEIEIVRISLQIASGLAAAHSQGLVHRDIKPANILVEKNVNRVLITDFGLARAEDDASLTRTGCLTGTPNYMSPEQARGERSDHRSDLFSFGSLIYFLATGRLPFRAESQLAVLNRIQNDEPTPIRQLNNRTSQTLSDITELLLAKNPADRIQTAGELHQILEKHLAFLHQPDITKPPRVKPVEKNHAFRVWGTLIAAAVLSGSALLAYPGWFSGAGTDTTPSEHAATSPQAALAPQTQEPSPAVAQDGKREADQESEDGSQEQEKGLAIIEELESSDEVHTLYTLRAFKKTMQWLQKQYDWTDDQAREIEAGMAEKLSQLIKQFQGPEYDSHAATCYGIYVEELILEHLASQDRFQNQVSDRIKELSKVKQYIREATLEELVVSFEFFLVLDRDQREKMKTLLSENVPEESLLRSFYVPIFRAKTNDDRHLFHVMGSIRENDIKTLLSAEQFRAFNSIQERCRTFRKFTRQNPDLRDQAQFEELIISWTSDTVDLYIARLGEIKEIDDKTVGKLRMAGERFGKVLAEEKSQMLREWSQMGRASHPRLTDDLLQLPFVTLILGDSWWRKVLDKSLKNLSENDKQSFQSFIDLLESRANLYRSTLAKLKGASLSTSVAGCNVEQMKRVSELISVNMVESNEIGWLATLDALSMIDDATIEQLFPSEYQRSEFNQLQRNYRSIIDRAPARERD